MEVRRPFEMALPEDLMVLARVFDGSGHQLYLVGGAVRDALMYTTPKDFDVATDATPDQIRAMLLPLGYSILEVGEAFGVIVLILPPPLEKLEIATFREDLSEGRHPIVRYATIKEDVQRRDLTINAVFYDIGRCEVVDLVGGLRDIEDRIIRTVGDPEDRFREDRLRVLRAIRFAARFGWTIEAKTAYAIARDNNLNGVSPERIRDEFVKGLASALSVRCFMKLLDEFNMWSRLFPGLTVTVSFGIESRSVPVVLGVLLDNNPLASLAKELNGLKYSSDEVSQATFLIKFRDITPETAYKLRRQANNTHVTNEVLVEYRGERGMPSPNMLRAFINYELSVTGDSLLQRGLSGAELGRELERLETVQFRRLLEDESRSS